MAIRKNETVRYLLPNEHEVVAVRYHPVILAKPAALAAGGLILALSITALAPALTWVWLGWAILLARLLWALLQWYVDFFVVTSKRFLVISGVFSRKIAMMPLVRVTDMTFERSFLGRMLGYGTFILESAGQIQGINIVDYLPWPEQLYLEVCSLLFDFDHEDFDDA